MRQYLLTLALISLLLVPAPSSAQRSAVLVIVDGLGSAYVNPDRLCTFVDGEPIESLDVGFFRAADARYELWVPVPETGPGHAVLVTGYSEASDETLTYYDATVFDCLRRQGHWCLGIMETGDSAAMVAELDCGAFESNNSATKPGLKLVKNEPDIPDSVLGAFEVGSLLPAEKGKSLAATYQQYNNWPLLAGERTIRFMNGTFPSQDYLLVVNVGGVDKIGHEGNCEQYREAILGLEPGFARLIGAARDCDVPVLVTADHGMSFKNAGSKGSHASGEAAGRNESRLIPLLLYADGLAAGEPRLGSQECVAPTLLSLLECPNTLSVGDGEPFGLGTLPSLYLTSPEAIEVTVEGRDFHEKVVVNGTCRVGPVEKGTYTISSAGVRKTIDLLHDHTVGVAGTSAPPTAWPGILPALLAGMVSVGGIVLALRVLRRSR